jgi:hypothetical protein
MLIAPLLDANLHHALVMRYADAVMRLAKLPSARRVDVEDGPRFSAAGDEIACTCGITGCEYTESWDGSEASALAFADDVGETTADLVKRIKKGHKYAWLYASR